MVLLCLRTLRLGPCSAPCRRRGPWNSFARRRSTRSLSRSIRGVPVERASTATPSGGAPRNAAAAARAQGRCCSRCRGRAMPACRSHPRARAAARTPPFASTWKLRTGHCKGYYRSIFLTRTKRRAHDPSQGVSHWPGKVRARHSTIQLYQIKRNLAHAFCMVLTTSS